MPRTFPVIPIKEALFHMERIAKENNFPSDQKSLYNSLIKSCQTMKIGSHEVVEKELLKNFMLNFKYAMRSEDSSILRRERGLKVDRIVDVVEFIESPEYMNQAGHIRPVIKKELHKLFHESYYVEAVLGGAIGVGKNYMADMAMAYMLYCLSCYHNPQVEYDLAPGSAIVFIVQSKSLTLARKVAFDQFAARLRLSPYFTKFFPYDASIRSELRFPNDINVLPVGGSDTSAIGMNVFGGCFPAGQLFLKADGDFADISTSVNTKVLTCDELNFMMLSENEVEPIPTGYKKLVKLHFDNGDSIVCSEDQKFRSPIGEWIHAKYAEGRAFKFANMQTMWESGYISDSAFASCSQDVGEGVQETVSDGKAVRECSVDTTAEQEEVERVCDLSSLSESLPNDKQHPFTVSQHDDEGIRREVSRCPNQNGGSEERLVREIQSACFGTAQRPGVQEITSERNSESQTPWMGKDEGALCRPRLDEVVVRDSPQNIPELHQGEEGSYFVVRSSGEKKRTSEPEESFCVPQTERGLCDTGFQIGSSCSLFAGQEGLCLGVRTLDYAVPNSMGGEALYPGLPSRGAVSRSEGGSCCQNGQELEVQIESSSRFSCDNERLSEKFSSNDSLQLDKPKQNEALKLGGADSQISSINCIRVEFLNVYAPVYDIKEVKSTHTFMCATNNNSGLLMASNCIDEMNFMARTADSVMTRFTGDTEYDQAEKLYETLIQRIKSRFMDKGKIPGKLLLISSANYTGDFTDRKRQEAKTDPTIFVMHYSQWDALPADRYCGERFLVEVGSDIKQPRIISSMSEAVDAEDVITIPVEYRRDFERDIIAALKNFAGVASGPSHPFIPQRELIKKAATDFVAMTGGRQLFMEETMCLNRVVDLNSPDWDLVVNEDYLEENILNKDQVFATHIDLSINKDACGIAIGHIMEYRELPEMTIYNPRMRDYVTVNDVMVPVYMIDGVLRVTAPPSGEIDYETIKRLILYIRGKINIKWGSLDFFQSQMMIQSFRRGGIKSGVMSIDKDIGPYSEVKSAIKDQRIYYPDHSVLLTELRELELDNIKGKVDHPAHGCHSGDTEVTIVENGIYRQLTFEELVILYQNGKRYKTVTFDVNSRCYKEAWIENPRITKTVTELLEIELETGDVIRCTPDHLYLLTNGTYKEAQYLTPEDEIFA
jgi:hypothetical protein